VFDATVIGGGANGTVAAATLARAGLRVLLLERSETLAGQAATFEFAPGYHAAPLLDDSGWVPPAVARAFNLDLPRSVADSAFTIAVDAGEFLQLGNRPQQTGEAIRRFSPKDAAKWPDFLAHLRRLAGFLEELYQRPAPDIDAASLRDAWPLLGLARKFRALGAADLAEFLRIMPTSVQQLAEDWFEAEPLRAAVAASGVRDCRHGPLAGGTSFILLHHLVGAAAGYIRGRGRWGTGPDAFTSAMMPVLRKHGVTLRTGAAVTQIAVRDDRVAGVVTESGEEIASTLVLSAADPARTLLHMLDPLWLDPELLHALQNIRFRGCTAFLLYALEALPEIPGVDTAAALQGTLSLTGTTDALERAADAVKYGRVPEQPHIEISLPTLAWPHLAPDGGHVLAARAHYVPYRLTAGETWDAARTAQLSDTVTRAIAQVIPCFPSRVRYQATLTPPEIERRHALTEGAATHGELGLDQILFMRPTAGLGRYRTPIEGLYLCGAGSHPGPGVNGGPGWLAARQVLVERGRKPGS
jgi:phytoene dehydrogenase-like protein